MWNLTNECLVKELLEISRPLIIAALAIPLVCIPASTDISNCTENRLALGSAKLAC